MIWFLKEATSKILRKGYYMMPKCSFALLTLSMSFSFSASSAIWEDTRPWTVQDEEQFSTWMQSSAVNETMFTDPKSRYYGINTDCADTAYALRAIYSFEHGLPFAITNPSGSRSGKTINNRQTNYDHLKTTEEKIIKLINDIGESVGTESLAFYDTYPVQIKAIKPGSLFMYKIKARFRNFIRHAYNIKNINPVGTFDVIYSTQANKEKKLPLIRRKEREFENLPHSPWGFRKFRWPEHLGKDLSAIPSSLGPSMEQYELATTLSEKDFFKYVRKTVATIDESPAQRVVRSLKAACLEAQARIDYVNQAIAHLNETNNACMNYEQFDAYSTPARDKALAEMFDKLNTSYKEAKKADELNLIPPETLILVEEVLNQGLFSSRDESNELIEFCPIEYKPGTKLSMKSLYKRILSGDLSSHPNDTIEVRWGEKGKKTKCKRWY